MTANERLEIAARSTTPVRTLRVLVHDLSLEGISKAEIYRMLETLLAQVRARPDFHEEDENAVLDVMDALTGWCHTDTELLPERPLS